MGHIRIGTLPATKRWKEVVGLITEGAEVSKVAESTIHASELAFNKVHDDFAFREAVWLMTQFGVAGSKDNPAQHLDSLGIAVSGASSVVEVALAVAGELDRRIDASRRRSDFGEMAQRALISSITEHLQEKTPGLIPPTAGEIKARLGKLGKKKEFAQLSRSFFSKLTNQCLEYFLSKNLAAHVGEARRFATTEQLAQFEAALTKHCDEASAIVEDFSADWFSKNRFEGGGEISREKAEGFGWYALEKMRRELAERAKSDA